MTPAVTTGNYTERLFSAQINDASSSSDFFQITNSTIVNHSFIPTLWGHHTTDNRRAFALLGSISPDQDVVDETDAIMVFDVRNITEPNSTGAVYGIGASVVNRPLFSFSNLNDPLFRIYPNGSIGIGTGFSSPTAQLHTTGTVRFQGLSSSSTAANMIVSDGDGNLYKRSLSSFISNSCATTNSIPKMTGSNTLGCSQIYDNGTNVLIGTSTASSSNWKLEVNGDARFHGIIQTSDKRYKKDISSIDGALDLILSLEGKSYKFKNKEFPGRNFNEKLHYGFIAQDVEKVVPEIVYDNEDGFKSLDYVAIIPMLVEAIKEQNKKIEALENLLNKQNNQSEKNEYYDLNNKYSGSELFQNNPNPYSENTEIGYFISEDFNNASIMVFDLNGNLLLNKPIASKGKGQVIIESNELNNGSFIYSLIIDGIEVHNKKMIKLK